VATLDVEAGAHVDAAGLVRLNVPPVRSLEGGWRYTTVPAGGAACRTYILKEAESWNTALTIANAMKPTNANTASNTPLAMMLVKLDSCWVSFF
jgi:hypothetical protein